VFLKSGSCQAENESQDQKQENHALPETQNAREPVTTEAFAGQYFKAFVLL
jgi:hypothetical protein